MQPKIKIKMLCCCSLELWYYTAVLILVGFLKNARLQIDVMSIW